MDSSVWKTACRFCGRLAETDGCKEYQERFKVHGHYPNGVWRYQVPGQPRIMARYRGECGRQLYMLSMMVVTKRNLFFSSSG